jgi:tetrahydromethanopterin S-methyltransferase subunit G
MDEELKQRLDAMNDKLNTISDMLTRQVAITEAVRSDVRLLTGMVRGLISMMQAMVGTYTDLSGRIIDLENPL